MSILDKRADQRTPQRPERTMIYGDGNRFDLDESKIPEGMTYKWLRLSCAGKEDQANQVLAEMNGWTPVPASRHPEKAGLRASPESCIIEEGLMLVEQPTAWSAESREVQDFTAKHQLESQIQRLGLASKREAKIAGAAGGSVGIGRHVAPLPGDAIE